MYFSCEGGSISAVPMLMLYNIYLVRKPFGCSGLVQYIIRVVELLPVIRGGLTTFGLSSNVAT